LKLLNEYVAVQQVVPLRICWIISREKEKTMKNALQYQRKFG